MSPEDSRRARDVAIGALKTIQALTQVGPDKAQDALQTINAIVDTLHDGLDGKTTPDIVEAELKAITSLINGTTIGDKFDTSDP